MCKSLYYFTLYRRGLFRDENFQILKTASTTNSAQRSHRVGAAIDPEYKATADFSLSVADMEKVAKRAAQAQKQALKRAKLQAYRQGNEQRARNRGLIKSATAEIKQNKQDAKAARREDWELGPLAPKRDLGFNHYGTFKEHPRMDYSLEGSLRVRSEVLAKRCAWAGTPKQLNIVAGDRVVILQGHDKGKIDRIKSVNAADGTVKLEEYNKVSPA